jgi:hypothetical protein
MFAIQRDEGRTFDLCGRCDDGVGATSTMTFVILPKDQASALGNLRIDGNDV